MIGLLENHFDMFRAGGKPLQVSGVQTAKIASMIIRNHLGMIVWILGVMAALMLIVSGLGMASGTGTSVIERTREIGVLRAIGATPSAVRRILGVETLFVTVVAWLLAIVLAPAVSRAASAYFGAGIVEYPFDYQTSISGIWISLAVMLVLTLVATWGPAHSVGRMAVSRAVAYE
jgi:putative ABC transport system permease protein